MHETNKDCLYYLFGYPRYMFFGGLDVVFYFSLEVKKHQIELEMAQPYIITHIKG